MEDSVRNYLGPVGISHLVIDLDLTLTERGVRAKLKRRTQVLLKYLVVCCTRKTAGVDYSLSRRSPIAARRTIARGLKRATVRGNRTGTIKAEHKTIIITKCNALLILLV